MLTQQQIEQNKHRFLAILEKAKSVSEDGMGKLIKKLEMSDFFVAPASTKYHNAFEGGLCQHCLNVYENLKSLVEMKQLQDKCPEVSVIIVGLLHDISKMNYYEPSVRNIKEYSDFGSKHDELGNFDWVAKRVYTAKDSDKRFIFGSHEQNSEFMVKTFLPLSIDESAAILHHQGGVGYDSVPANIPEIYKKFPLANLLHLADMMATYIDEAVDESVY